jgi:hypothetical protein
MLGFIWLGLKDSFTYVWVYMYVFVGLGVICYVLCVWVLYVCGFTSDSMASHASSCRCWLSLWVYVFLWVLCVGGLCVGGLCVWVLCVGYMYVGYMFVGYMYVGYMFVGYMYVGYMFVGFAYLECVCSITSSRVFNSVTALASAACGFCIVCWFYMLCGCFMYLHVSVCGFYMYDVGFVCVY